MELRGASASDQTGALEQSLDVLISEVDDFLDTFVSEAGGDPEPQGCTTKDPGLKDFIPVSDFKLENLPKEHQNEEKLKSILLWADLTVKAIVKFVSLERPETFRGLSAPFPNYKLRGSRRKVTSASGYIFSITPEEDINRPEVCPCLLCQKSSENEKPKGQCWYFTLVTSIHVVHDSSEAERSQFECFYDADETRAETVKCLYGISAYQQTQRDNEKMSYVICVAHDKELAEKLRQLIKQRDKIVSSFHSLSSGGPAVLISHPEGKSKRISVGHVLHLTVTTGDDYPINKPLLFDGETECILPYSSLSKVPVMDIAQAHGADMCSTDSTADLLNDPNTGILTDPSYDPNTGILTDPLNDPNTGILTDPSNDPNTGIMTDSSNGNVEQSLDPSTTETFGSQVVDHPSHPNGNKATDTNNTPAKTTDNTNSIPDKTTDNTNIIPDKTTDNTNVLSDKTTDNTNIIPDKPTDNTNIIPDKTTDNTNIIPDKTTDNTNIIPDKTTDNTNIIPDKTTYNTNIILDKTTDNTNIIPDKTTDNTNNIPDKTTDNTNIIPDKTTDNTNIILDKTTDNTNIIPDKTTDNTNIIPDKTTDNTNVIPDKTTDNTDIPDKATDMPDNTDTNMQDRPDNHVSGQMGDEPFLFYYVDESQDGGIPESTFILEPDYLTSLTLPPKMTFTLPEGVEFARRYDNMKALFQLPPETKFHLANGKEVYLPPEAQFYSNQVSLQNGYVSYRVNSRPGSSGGCVLLDGGNSFTNTFPHGGSTGGECICALRCYPIFPSAL